MFNPREAPAFACGVTAPGDWHRACLRNSANARRTPRAASLQSKTAGIFVEAIFHIRHEEQNTKTHRAIAFSIVRRNEKGTDHHRPCTKVAKACLSSFPFSRVRQELAATTFFRRPRIAPYTTNPANIRMTPNNSPFDSQIPFQTGFSPLPGSKAQSETLQPAQRLSIRPVL